MRRQLLGVLLLLLVVLPVLAQAADVNNPTAVTWTASADHATVDGYTVEILRPDGSLLQTLDALKPTPDATNTCRFSLSVQSVAFASGYSVRVRARAGTAVSDWSLSVNKFNRVPGKPGVVTVL